MFSGVIVVISVVIALVIVGLILDFAFFCMSTAIDEKVENDLQALVPGYAQRKTEERVNRIIMGDE